MLNYLQNSKFLKALPEAGAHKDYSRRHGLDVVVPLLFKLRRVQRATDNASTMSWRIRVHCPEVKLAVVSPNKGTRIRKLSPYSIHRQIKNSYSQLPYNQFCLTLALFESVCVFHNKDQVSCSLIVETKIF